MAHGGVPLSQGAVAYQGLAGAFSEAAASALFPRAKTVPLRTFADVFGALGAGFPRDMVLLGRKLRADIVKRPAGTSAI